MTGSGRLRSLVHGPVVVAMVLLLAGPPGAIAEPAVNIQTRYYPVTGRTDVQIRRSLDRGTPVRQNGRPFDAYTRWDIDWQFQWAFDGDGSCRVMSVSTVVRILQTLPRLENAGALPPDLAGRWDRYMRALAVHEEGHVALGIDAARDIEQQLMQMGDRSSCHQLESEANSLAREIIARYALEEDRYDADTNYGERDGARFP